MAVQIPNVKFSNGLEIPILGLGTWKSETGKVYEAVKTAIDAGYRHIDCAFAYQNESEVGKAITEMIAEGKVTRQELFITSKCWNNYHTKDRVVDNCRLTLKDLQLDYLDLYLVHFPFAYKQSDEPFPKDENDQIISSDLDFIETWEGMEECHKLGLVKSIGLSNFNTKQIAQVLNVAKIKPVNLQIECHPYLTQEKLIAFCKEHDITVTAYSPLGSPDRPWAKPGEPLLLEDPVITEIANSHKKTPAQVLIKFQLQRGLITTPKSVTKERIISNLQVFDFELTEDQIKKIAAFNMDHRFVALEWMKDHKYYPFHEV